MLVRITSPYFVAGLVLRNNTVVKYAPILHYMKTWNLTAIIEYCKRKKWHWETFNDLNGPV